MKANQALIAWTPGLDVLVAPIEDGNKIPVDAYTCTGGAAYTATRALKGDASKLQVFTDFHKLVMPTTCC